MNKMLAAFILFSIFAHNVPSDEPITLIMGEYEFTLKYKQSEDSSSKIVSGMLIIINDEGLDNNDNRGICTVQIIEREDNNELDNLLAHWRIYLATEKSHMQDGKALSKTELSKNEGGPPEIRFFLWKLLFDELIPIKIFDNIIDKELKAMKEISLFPIQHSYSYFSSPMDMRMNETVMENKGEEGRKIIISQRGTTSRPINPGQNKNERIISKQGKVITYELNNIGDSFALSHVHIYFKSNKDKYLKGEYIFEMSRMKKPSSSSRASYKNGNSMPASKGDVP